jgi:hypothetical protein
MAKDIVCGMNLEMPLKIFTEYENKKYDFCSEDLSLFNTPSGLKIEKFCSNQKRPLKR